MAKVWKNHATNASTVDEGKPTTSPTVYLAVDTDAERSLVCARCSPLLPATALAEADATTPAAPPAPDTDLPRAVVPDFPPRPPESDKLGMLGEGTMPAIWCGCDACVDVIGGVCEPAEPRC